MYDQFHENIKFQYFKCMTNFTINVCSMYVVNVFYLAMDFRKLKGAAMDFRKLKGADFQIFSVI